MAESKEPSAKKKKRRLKEKRPSRVGGVVIFVAIAAAILGVGLVMGNRNEASKTPCQRYAHTVSKALDNCHSGMNRSSRHHIAICERRIDATDECLEKIRSLSCDQLEAGGAAAAEICQK